jgi:hypothetical protein
MPGLVLSYREYNKMISYARYPWLTPVIPAIQEAEIRKIVVPGQPR